MSLINRIGWVCLPGFIISFNLYSLYILKFRKVYCFRIFQVAVQTKYETEMLLDRIKNKYHEEGKCLSFV